MYRKKPHAINLTQDYIFETSKIYLSKPIHISFTTQRYKQLPTILQAFLITLCYYIIFTLNINIC